METATNIDGTKFKPAAPVAEAGQHRFTRARLVRFLSVFVTTLLAANVFALATWNHFMGLTGIPAWEVLPPLLSLAFVATTILARLYSNVVLRWASRVTAVWLGILNFSFFAAVAAWILLAVTSLLPWYVASSTIAVTMLGAVVLVSLYGIANANRLQVTEVSVKLPHLPAAWRGRTAVLVTDLHLGNIRGARFLKRVVAKIQKLRPQAVFISGDLFDGTKADFQGLLEPAKQWSVPAGTYYVSGNHEEFGERAPFLNAVRQTGIRVLDNEKVVVDGLQIIGLHDTEAQDEKLSRACLTSIGVETKCASILLAHQPSNLDAAASAGISLQVSGHTHGGQFWPWNMIVSRVHGPFAYGLNRFKDMQVLTSSGAGTWGPPFRVGTKAELVLIRFDLAEA